MVNSVAEALNLEPERRHEGDDHAAGHHAAQAVRQDLRDERGVSGVAAGAETDARRLGQRKGDHARHQEDEHRRQLEEAGEDGAAPGFLLSPVPMTISFSRSESTFQPSACVQNRARPGRS